MKPDSTSAALNLSRKIRGIFCSAFAVVLMGSAPLKNQQVTVVPELIMTPTTLKSIPVENRIVVDTRSKWKFLLSHVPGAVNLSDWREFTSKKDGVAGLLIEDKTFISNKLGPLGFSRERPIIIYGEPDDPWRTDGRFFWMFERYGFSNVSILDGGLDYWRQTGGTLERGPQRAPKPSQWPPESINLNSDIIADKYLIKNILFNKNFVLIDNRTLKEFNGATPFGSQVGGHIPNAKHIPWPDFFNKDGTLKSIPQLSSLMEQQGIGSNQEIVVYCTGGVRSAMAYFVFRYLGFKVRNYDGSWWDWSHDSTLPVETSG
mgnify:FL=1